MAKEKFCRQKLPTAMLTEVATEHRLPDMKLSEYLRTENLSMGEFARRIEVRNARTVQRYVNGQRIPSRSIMADITRETGGKVQPNDFFDLEDT